MCTPVADSYGWTQVVSSGETNVLPAPLIELPLVLAAAVATKIEARPIAVRATKRFTGSSPPELVALQASSREPTAWAKGRWRSGDGVVNGRMLLAARGERTRGI